MLQQTFLHLPGVGKKREKQLWDSGILHWEEFEKKLSPQPELFRDGANTSVISALTDSREALLNGDMDFFGERLPKAEHYRIALTVPDQTLFLDIETTGLSTYYDHITLVGGSIGLSYYCLTPNTNKREIRNLINSAKCLVTFNGTMFDIKFLQQEISGLELPKSHVDLRFLAARLGHRGGQKKLEDKFGFVRPKAVADVRGDLAPVLWHEYQLGQINSARRLVRYNQYDVYGMRTLFDKLMAQLISTGNFPIETRHVPTFGTKPNSLRWAKQRSEANRDSIYLPKKIGGGKPRISYKNLSTNFDTRHLRFVGIDLTGSEARATGWCFLNGNHATTKLVNTDEDILIESLTVKPTVVSIDSPLSLPKGRSTVGDDDPAREAAGIMRACERTLKKRGVNVYPALIPSMQKLTARGMKLANQFRAMGVPVIESYPGAAQDIMGIPRKRASLEQLKHGLAAFGVRGKFLEKDTTHDEIDAITAAVVGLFFWSGRFEALGNEIEDYLIIPDLNVSIADWRQRSVIGLSGPIAAGKTTAATFLEEKGFAYIRFSQILGETLHKQGKKPTRQNLQDLGEEINKHAGQHGFAKMVANYHTDAKKIVIDGLRHPEDHACMVESFGPAFRHMHVSAPETERNLRYRKLKYTVREFQESAAHPVETRVEYLKGLAHSIMDNSTTIKEFTCQFEKTIST